MTVCNLWFIFAADGQECNVSLYGVSAVCLFLYLSVGFLAGHKTPINSMKIAERDGIYRDLDLKGHIQDFGLSTTNIPPHQTDFMKNQNPN